MLKKSTLNIDFDWSLEIFDVAWDKLKRLAITHEFCEWIDDKEEDLLHSKRNVAEAQLLDQH